MNLELAAELCRRYEGYRAKPYLCPAGVATIGYGSTYYADKRKVTLEDALMDESTARALLMGVTQLQPGYQHEVLSISTQSARTALSSSFSSAMVITPFVVSVQE